jgi:hypothetical protein
MPEHSEPRPTSSDHHEDPFEREKHLDAETILEDAGELFSKTNEDSAVTPDSPPTAP